MGTLKKTALYATIILLTLSLIIFVAQRQTSAQTSENCAELSPCNTASTGAAAVYLPLLTKPATPPTLHPIANADRTNVYSVYWESSAPGYYVLQEAQDPSFSDAQVVHQGTGNYWAVPQPGKLPGTYYYRVGIRANGEIAAWSNTEAITIHPLFVGLDLRWDGVGYINIGQHYEPGIHQTRHLDDLTAPDTVRVRYHDWYDPDPLDFGETTYDSFYSVSTGEFLSSSVPGNPAWKWGYPWIIPYGITFAEGQVISIGGQEFDVTGPHSGHTAFGQPVQYWQMVNRERFLYHDDGSEWTQYVHPGDISLRYDAGRTRLLLHSNILRRYYQNGDLSNYTVQYIINLTESNSFIASGTGEGQNLYEVPAEVTVPTPSADTPQLPGMGMSPSYP